MDRTFPPQQLRRDTLQDFENDQVVYQFTGKMQSYMRSSSSSITTITNSINKSSGCRFEQLVNHDYYSGCAADAIKFYQLLLDRNMMKFTAKKVREYFDLVIKCRFIIPGKESIGYGHHHYLRGGGFIQYLNNNLIAVMSWLENNDLITKFKSRCISSSLRKNKENYDIYQEASSNMICNTGNHQRCTDEFCVYQES